MTTLLALTAVLAIADPVPPDPSPFPLGVYWPIERVPWMVQRAGAEFWAWQEALLRRLKDEFACDTVWCVNGGTAHWQKLLELGERVGLSFLMTPEQVIHVHHHRDPKLVADAAQRAVAALGGYRSLAAYVLIDEPRAGEMEHMEALRAAFAREDPGRPSVVVAMVRDTQAALERTGLATVCTDVYPFGYAGDPNLPNTPSASRGYYRGSVQGAVRLARARGKQAWIMPQVFADVWGPWHYDAAGNAVVEPGAYHHWRQPTVGETRWQIWCAVAEGAKGVLFYVLFPPANDRQPGDPPPRQAIPDGMPLAAQSYATGGGMGLLTPDGAATPQMVAMGQVFGVLRAHAPLLARLEPARAEGLWTAAPLVVRSYTDPADGGWVAVAVNDATEETTRGELRSVVPLARCRDLRSGQELAVTPDEATGGSRVALELAPGDGALLSLEPAGATLSSLFREDWRVATTPCRLEDVKRLVTEAPYNTGWSHAVEAGEQPGTITLDLNTVAGRERRGLELFLSLRGRGEVDQPLQVRTSVDGQAWDEPRDGLAGPVRLPAEARYVRVWMWPRARVDELALMAVKRH